MDREGLRLEIELLQGKEGDSTSQDGRLDGPMDVLLTIHSKEVDSHLTAYINSHFPKWNIRHAGDALEAYAQLEHEPADLLICELCMPYMTGYGLMKKLNSRVDLKQIPIVLISPEPLNHTIDTETVWLSDPFNHVDLKQALDKVIGRA